MQPAATVWLSEDKERQSYTVLHQSPAHSPAPAVARTIWRPSDCFPQFEKNRRPYGKMPRSHPTNRQQGDTQRTEVTPQLLHDRLKSPVRRCTEAVYYTELSRSSTTHPHSLQRHGICITVTISLWRSLKHISQESTLGAIRTQRDPHPMVGACTPVTTQLGQ